MMTKVQQM